MKVEFECIICGDTATARVDEDETSDYDRPLETVRECPSCGLETIWIES